MVKKASLNIQNEEKNTLREIVQRRIIQKIADKSFLRKRGGKGREKSIKVGLEKRWGGLTLQGERVILWADLR